VPASRKPTTANTTGPPGLTSTRKPVASRPAPAAANAPRAKPERREHDAATEREPGDGGGAFDPGILVWNLLLPGVSRPGR
jgi:hypothetical protein